MRLWRKLADKALIGCYWRTESVAPHPKSIWFFCPFDPSPPWHPCFTPVGTGSAALPGKASRSRGARRSTP